MYAPNFIDSALHEPCNSLHLHILLMYMYGIFLVKVCFLFDKYNYNVDFSLDTVSKLNAMSESFLQGHRWRPEPSASALLTFLCKK